jgi:hypothetical protein
MMLGLDVLDGLWGKGRAGEEGTDDDVKIM